MPISAVDTISLAFDHTKRQLLRPFRFWQWTRLALVGLLAGEMGSGGGVNFPTSFPRGGSTPRNLPGGLPHIDLALLGLLITVIVVAAIVFGIVMLYISGVMRFILFDSILTRECRIRDGWSRRQTQGWKFFLWQLGFTLFTLFVTVILLGIPAAFAFAMGWFAAPRDHIVALVLTGIVVVFILLIFSFALGVVRVLTKDFVVPQMALEDIGPVEGWRRLWPMIQSEKSGYAIYIGMKIALAIGAGIVVGIVTFLLALLVAIPVVGIAIAAVLAGKSAGFTWNAGTITAVVVIGCILFVIFLFLIALISVPVIVFFPAYSIYFFAPRYRPLSLALYPPPAGIAGAPPPQQPPPLPPAPQLA